MIRKRALTALTAVVMAAALAGCGSAQGGESSENTSSPAADTASVAAENTSAETSADTEETPSEAPAPEPLTPAEPSADAAVMRGLTANEYAKEMGVGINLGNTFEAFWEDKANETTGAQTIGANTPQDYEKCWGAVVTTDECIDGMAAAGFSTVRVPVYWGNMMSDDGEYRINGEYIARVREVVDRIIEDKMYAVINIHHYDEFLIKNKPKDEVLKITGSLWQQIADYFAGYGDYLVFEGFNENVGSHMNKEKMSPADTFEYANALNQTFVDTVRASGGNNGERLLIASGYNTNIDKTTDSHFVMPTDTAADKLMISVHYIDNGNYWANTVGGDAWREYSTAQCELLTKAFTEKGIPVFVGECTSIYEDEHFAEDADVTDSSECLRYILGMAVDDGFVPVLWDVNDNFYSRTDCKIKSDSDAEVIKDIADKIKNS